MYKSGQSAILLFKPLFGYMSFNAVLNCFWGINYSTTFMQWGIASPSLYMVGVATPAKEAQNSPPFRPKKNILTQNDQH